ncbi:PspC domain-containing protein [Thalassotalea euphylliae]|uniref:PspC domain-containing protein n=1 Tax=Thalassotalea euphylliae TaxID=1655234 RepID=A0A3E0UBE5_9GAMM|nr:PspC domain-containing protein [Thalassotalea euphylliae]REL30833.1 PspC domain-containing protein [Thalassotalea euphylliae]REL34256.1 PspC domain-containing protein [Thalassotalea euphylliae]
MSYKPSYLTRKQLTKDVLHKKVSGVCAGIARYYQWPRWGIRVAAILALLTFPVATGVAYLVAAMLLPTRA